VPARNSLPAKRFAKASASSGLEKQNTTKSPRSRSTRGPGGHRAAENMSAAPPIRPPVALEIAAGDFALAVSQRRIAISLLAGTLNTRALRATSIHPAR
jgi:hypothetical protein